MPGKKDDEILFIGKITASITHEIKNVLASIKELSGLLDDLVSMSDDFPLKEKFQNVIPRILNQVERGAELTKNFNTFSHLADEQIAKIDLNRAIEHLVSISQRLARQRDIKLFVGPPGISGEIESEPLKLYMGLFYVLEFLMAKMVNGGKINICTINNDGNYEVEVKCEGEIANHVELLSDLKSSAEWANVNNIINGLGGSVNYDDANSRFIITLAMSP